MAKLNRILTPQQELFLERYTNPKSPTFGNAMQSALTAGYAQEYAENITHLMPEWLSENLGDMRRLKKAEKNLTEVQNIEVINEEGKPDAQLIEKRTKVDMFLAERLDKTKYSTRQELTGKNGGELVPTQFSEEERNALISLLNDKEGS
jgi:hypothetical protein